MTVLVCNAGSTSLKFKVYEMPEEKVLATGRVERVGSSDDALFEFRNMTTQWSLERSKQNIPDYRSGIEMFLTYLTDSDNGVIKSVETIGAVGYKTVLAKGFYGVHELSENVLGGMRAWLSLAPVHNRAYLECIAAMKKVLPSAVMVGAFETAFHTTIPQERKMYGIPYEWYEKYGVQRLGFHGASHSYIASVLDGERREYRAISCHLGGSGSICAIRSGRSVDTSFGMSLETGLIHANRVGDMDPTLVYYLEDQGLDREEVHNNLVTNGGLRGISGVSGDMRYVEEAAEKGNVRAQLAVDVYVNSIVHSIGAFYPDLGGLDYLVFTAGIGEHSPLVRKKVCSFLSSFGVLLDDEKNLSGSRVISAENSAVTVMVIPTDEEIIVCRRTYEFIRGGRNA